MASSEEVGAQLARDERRQRAIRRRERPVGLIDDVDAVGGTSLWDTPEPHHGYVRGRWSDEGPLAAVFWADLRRAYRILHIDPRKALVFEYYMDDVSNRGIAALLGISRETVRRDIKAVTEEIRAYVEQVEKDIAETYTEVEGRLECYKRLGLLTVQVEECGGWSVVGQFV